VCYNESAVHPWTRVIGEAPKLQPVALVALLKRDGTFAASRSPLTTRAQQSQGGS